MAVKKLDDAHAVGSNIDCYFMLISSPTVNYLIISSSEANFNIQPYGQDVFLYDY